MWSSGMVKPCNKKAQMCIVFEAEWEYAARCGNNATAIEYAGGVKVKPLRTKRKIRG